jgi:hypothetical protein
MTMMMIVNDDDDDDDDGGGNGNGGPTGLRCLCQLPTINVGKFAPMRPHPSKTSQGLAGW